MLERVVIDLVFEVWDINMKNGERGLPFIRGFALSSPMNRSLLRRKQASVIDGQESMS